MHSRSNMSIDPRIPTMSGRRTSSFQRPGRHRVHQARSTVRCCSAIRTNGQLLITKGVTWKRVTISSLCWGVVRAKTISFLDSVSSLADHTSGNAWERDGGGGKWGTGGEGGGGFR